MPTGRVDRESRVVCDDSLWLRFLYVLNEAQLQAPRTRLRLPVLTGVRVVSWTHRCARNEERRTRNPLELIVVGQPEVECEMPQVRAPILAADVIPHSRNT